MKPPFRKKLHACVHPQTYKYFLRPDGVDGAWRGVVSSYGPARHHAILPMLEVETDRLLLRAPESGNPITVIRKRSCTLDDVARLHDILGFEPPSFE